MKIIKNNKIHLSVLVVLFSIIFMACDDLFKVDNPNYVEDSNVTSQEFIGILGDSPEGNLSRFYSTAVIVAGMPSDEVMAQQTSQGGDNMVDIGVFEDNLPYTDNPFNNLSQARWVATDASKRLEELVDNPATSIELAKSYFWDGIARTTLADMYEGVPLDNGPIVSPIDTYVTAINLFEKSAAIFKAIATDLSTTYEAAAYTSIARVYRTLYFERGQDNNSLIQAEDYAKKALQVNPEFKLEIVYDPPGTQNALYTSLNQGSYIKMDPVFANRVDPVSGDLDPRIQHGSLLGLSNLRGDEVYHQLKYTSESASVPVSRWQEAELILAEYEVLLGTPSNAVLHINNVRNAAGLPDFASAVPSEIHEQIKYERATEFWLELRRWQDMRYYNIIPDTWIPAEAAKGVDRRFPISTRERDANPNF
ncbi:MAG: RagB/SusD family nutrient uptake outer membrane protein [Balneolaceae bacterium]